MSSPYFVRNAGLDKEPRPGDKCKVDNQDVRQPLEQNLISYRLEDMIPLGVVGEHEDSYQVKCTDGSTIFLCRDCKKKAQTREELTALSC